MENTQPVAGQYSKPKLTPVFQMFEDAVKTWRQHFRQFILIYWEGFKKFFVPFLGGAVLILLLSLLISQSGTGALLFLPLSLFIGFIIFIIFIYFTTRAYMAMFLFVKYGNSGEPKKLFEETKKLFWPYLFLSLLTTILVLLWMLLLIIPGIVFAVLYSCAVYVFFFEGKRGMEAIKRSQELVKGYFWGVFGRILFLTFVAVIFMNIIALPLTVSPKEVAEAFSWWNVIVQIVSFLVAPIALYFSYYIYKDLVKIKQ